MSFHWKNEKHPNLRIPVIGIAGAAVIAACISLAYVYTMHTPEGQNKAFQKFTKELFSQEVSSNTISLHYTLKNPENYGIKNTEITFGGMSTDADITLASVENVNNKLKTFSYDSLSVENRLTYDVLADHLDYAKESAAYLLYEEPLGLVSGIQTQLPVILSEYQFYDEEDVQEYLALMQTTPEYFDSVIQFEQEKSAAGLFMSDTAADQVISQCTAFQEMGNNNYLISTFVDRIETVDGLSEKEKSSYIQENAAVLETDILPAYSELVEAVQALKGTGINEQGLCFLPEGKEYYEMILQHTIGTKRSVEEIRDLTRSQIIEDIEAMEEVLGISYDSGEEAIESAAEGAALQVSADIAQNPVTILKTLKEKISSTFPEIPEITFSVKYVPEELQETLSPAFYMIPAIDDYTENVIYVNQAYMNDSVTLFTTLAHEGYPGHLYQTVYYASTKPDPIRNLLSCGGYVEGWATYAEMCSYYLAPLTDIQAVLLQKNSSVILGLYTLADIGIHYDGWSREDTLAFFSNYGISDQEVVDRIYDLILGAPANYPKYYIGYVEFLELKKQWVEEKGEDFTQKEFHEAVLNVGPAPFYLVEKYAEHLL